MISVEDLTRIAEARLKDAEILAANERYDGAIYLCGYAVEISLKAQICRTLNWAGFPSTQNEFKEYTSFKTHNLDVLLHLTGIETHIKSELLADWSTVAQWESEARYNPIGRLTSDEAFSMISSSRAIMAEL